MPRIGPKSFGACKVTLVMIYMHCGMQCGALVALSMQQVVSGSSGFSFVMWSVGPWRNFNMTRNQDQCTSFFGGKSARTEIGYQMIKDVVN